MYSFYTLSEEKVLWCYCPVQNFFNYSTSQHYYNFIIIWWMSSYFGVRKIVACNVTVMPPQCYASSNQNKKLQEISWVFCLNNGSYMMWIRLQNDRFIVYVYLSMHVITGYGCGVFGKNCNRSQTDTVRFLSLTIIFLKLASCCPYFTRANTKPAPCFSSANTKLAPCWKCFRIKKSLILPFLTDNYEISWVAIHIVQFFQIVHLKEKFWGVIFLHNHSLELWLYTTFIKSEIYIYIKAF